VGGRDFARFLITDTAGRVHFEREGAEGPALRVLQIPFVDGEGAPLLIALLDEDAALAPAGGVDAGTQARSLVSLIPFSLALI
ncbi:hypothetical protein, partial [Klebsiella pneumoniae]